MGEPFKKVETGFKGTSFLDAGMIVNMYCGECNGDGCDECEDGTVLVRITPLKIEQLPIEPNDVVQLEATFIATEPMPHPTDAEPKPE